MSTNVPLVSLIIPVFNTPEVFLHECIESVLAQTWPNIEILLIDNNSSVKTKHLCQDFARKHHHITCIVEKKRGVSAARNRGIDESKGEYLCFVDSDDTVAPDYVKSMMIPMLAGRADVGACMIWNERALFSGAASPKYGKNLLLSSIVAITRLRGAIFDKIYRKSTLCRYNIRFDERYRIAEDEIFSVEYLLHCSTVEICMDGEKYYYRMNPFSVINSHQNDVFDDKVLDPVKAIGRRILPLLHNKGWKIRLVIIAEMYRVTDVAMNFLKSYGKHHTRLYRILWVKRCKSFPAMLIVRVKHRITSIIQMRQCR